MENLNSLLQIAAGIGLFLFAMYLIEEALKNLSGRAFKLFLQRITKNNVGAVAGGTVVTAILQSSSMVSFMVLAFVGAGVFTMKNAMAIILGANLGTTLASWLLATLGFKSNIEVVAFPVVAIGGFLLILFGSRPKMKYLAYFLLGFGLLFIALSYMKTAMEAQVEDFNLAAYASLPNISFLLLGFTITTIVQSSSVTMALSLSALHAGVLDFPMAAAIVLGSETGTTIKIVLGAIGGNAAKKRVALGNILFNIILTILAFALLNPILLLITDIIGIKDPLISLVTFSSLINLFAILLFLPILNSYAKFLERFFKDSAGTVAAFLGHASINEPETALDLFRRETKYFIHNSMLFNLKLFKIDTLFLDKDSDFTYINEKRNYTAKTQQEKYEFLKQLQGELQAFYMTLRQKLEGEKQAELNQMISAVRSAMHAVKSMKDIGTNISNLRHSSKDIKYQFFIHHKQEVEMLYTQLNLYLNASNTVNFEQLQLVFDTIQSNYSNALNDFYLAAQQATLENIDITTIINFNRELFTSNKAMLMAVKELVLNEKQAEFFNDVPKYKT